MEPEKKKKNNVAVGTHMAIMRSWRVERRLPPVEGSPCAGPFLRSMLNTGSTQAQLLSVSFIFQEPLQLAEKARPSLSVTVQWLCVCVSQTALRCRGGLRL